MNDNEDWSVTIEEKKFCLYKIGEERLEVDLFVPVSDDHDLCTFLSAAYCHDDLYFLYEVGWIQRSQNCRSEKLY